MFGDQLLQEFFGSSDLLQVGGEADVEGGLSVVGDDVSAAAAGDGADVERRVPEDGVGVGGEAVGELAVEEVEGGGEFENGVFAEVRLGGVGGFTRGLDGGPEGPFGGVHEVEGGGLADEGEFVFGGVVLGEVFGAGLMGFFAHEADEVDGDR